jgi:hypothetical protein
VRIKALGFIVLMVERTPLSLKVQDVEIKIFTRQVAM